MTRMNGFSISVAAAAILLMAAVTGWAQEPQSAWVQDLVARLGDNGWSLQERSEFAFAADRLDWSGARAANAESVALAVSLQKRENLGLTEGEHAQIALQLALMNAEMKAAGLNDHDCAVAATDAVRAMQGEIHAWMEGGRHGELGQLVRSRIDSAVKLQVQAAARSQPAGRWSGSDSGMAAGGSDGAGTQGSGGPSTPHGNKR